MFLNILCVAGMWFVGLLLYSFGIMQIVLVLFCTIPATRRFSAICRVDKNGIYKRCTVTVVLWGVIAGLAIWAVVQFGNVYAVAGFWVGIGITFLLSLGKWGLNPSNLAGYFQTYGKFYDQDALKEILDGAQKETQNLYR